MEAYWGQLETFVREHVVPYGWNIVAALLVFVIGLWVVARISNWIKGLLGKRLDPVISQFVAKIIHVLLFMVITIAALDRLGINTTSLVAVLGAAGLAVGLALKDSLSNFAAGVMLIMFRPFRIGHYVEIAGTAGTVQELRIFATVLSSPDNKVITVPNGKILSGTIVNYSEKPTRRVDMMFRVSYDADLSEVKRLLVEALAVDGRCLPEPAPTIVVGELAENSVNVLCRPWVKSVDYWGVKWGVTEEVKRRFDAAGIATPFPQMDVHLDKPEQPSAA